MISSQFRENEKSARFEVSVIPGNRCVLRTAEAGMKTSAAEAKGRLKKTLGQLGWEIGEREQPFWVDLEAELERILSRASIDFGIRTREDESAGAAFLERLRQLHARLYSSNAEHYLTYLGTLNLFEYFRLVSASQRVEQETSKANPAIVGDDYSAARRLALEMDLAELTEWLIAHDIGLPDLDLFLGNSDIFAEGNSEKKTGKTKKKTSEEESSVIPPALRYTVELIRLHQATDHDLLKFVDQVKANGNLETARQAVEEIAKIAAWIDVEQFESLYESVKREEALAIERQQAYLERQREMYDNQARRGKGQRSRDFNPRNDRDFRNDRSQIRLRETEQPQLGEHSQESASNGTQSENGEQPNPSEGELPFGDNLEINAPSRESGAEEISDAGINDQGGSFATDENSRGLEDGSFDMRPRVAQPGQHSRPHQNPKHNKRNKRRHDDGGVGRGLGGPGHFANRPRHPRSGPVNNGPGRRRSGPGGQQGPNFDEMQPHSNYSPGLPPAGQSITNRRGPGGPPAHGKGKWRGPSGR